MVTCKDPNFILNIFFDNTKFFEYGLDTVSIANDGGFINIHCRQWMEGSLVQLYLLFSFGLMEFQGFLKLPELFAAMGNHDPENAVNEGVVEKFGFLSIEK